MRVLHFFKTYMPDTTGGIEQVVFQLCEEAHKSGIEARVLTLSEQPQPSRIQVANHTVVRARQAASIASTGLSLEVFARFREMACEADIVHFHFPWPMMDLVHFMTRHRRPTVLSYHSDIVRQQRLLRLYRPLMVRFLSSVDRILVASPNYLASSEDLQMFAEKVDVIPFGLDQAAYPSASITALQKWRERVGEGFFLFVGVLRYYKGLSYLLEALRDTNWPVVIVGSGPEEASLKEQARQSGLDNVVFLGRVSDQDKVCLLQLSLAMVFPSHLRSEAFGISLLESAMFGKPMISCEIGTGTSFVNLHEQTGLVVPPADPVALRAALHQLWSRPDWAARLGRQARQRFQTLFTAEHMAGQVHQVYRALLTS